MYYSVFEPAKHRKIPAKNTFFARAEHLNRSTSPQFEEGDSVYAMAIDRYSERVARMARDKYLPNKYKKDVDILEETMSDRPWATHLVVFYTEDSLYEYMKSLHKMSQKDADAMLGDMLFDFGYTEDVGWFI